MLARISTLPTPRPQSTAIDALISEVRPALLGALCRLLLPADAEEVFQESCLRLYLKQESLATEAWRPFLFRAARNLALSRLRHDSVVTKSAAQLTIHHELMATPLSAEQQFSDLEEQDILLAAINAMPPACRRVFVLRKLEGRSHSDIAALMGISTNTVENHLTRGMNFCRAFVAERQAESASEVASKEGVA